MKRKRSAHETIMKKKKKEKKLKVESRREEGEKNE